MTDPYTARAVRPHTIRRWSKWIDVADRATRYLVTVEVPDGALGVPVRLISDASHPAAGQVFYVRREQFGRRLRQVNG